MNKAELIDAVAASTQLKKTQVELALEGLVEVITAALAKGDEVKLVGFGTFSVSERGERQGRNPATGESVTIAPRTVAAFKPGRTLRGAVRGD